MFDPTQINQEAFRYYGRLQRVKDFVDDNITDDIPVSVVARVAGLEEKYFSTFFRRKTGIRFKQWVSFLRVNRAMAILASRNRSISEVASAVGFHDVRTFERAFKRFTSMTPLEYKKVVRPC